MARNHVIWKEGLFVKPQHFQQESKAVENHANQRFSSISDFLYGFSELELSSEYLGFGKVALVSAKGVMPDGSVFDIPGDDAPPTPLSIEHASALNQTVYLAVPLKAEGVLQVKWPDSHATTRYALRSAEVRDVHSVDGDHVHMEVAALNISLMLEQEDRSAYTSIAMTRIVDRRPDGSLVLDSAFYPTSVSIHAIPALKRFLVEASTLMRDRANGIAGRIRSPNQTGVADLADFNLLQVLNRLFPIFQHLSSLRHLHPERLYVALAQACGELATFTDETRLPAEYPSYQHNQLRDSFQVLEKTLRSSLGMVLQPKAIPIPLTEQKFGVMTAAIHDRTLLDGANFVIAVRANMPPEKLRQRLTQQMKVAAQDKLSELVSFQLPGIPLVNLPVAPRHLPFHAGFHYFELDRTGAAWEAMKNAPGFGFHVSGDFDDLEVQFWAIRA